MSREELTIKEKFNMLAWSLRHLANALERLGTPSDLFDDSFDDNEVEKLFGIKELFRETVIKTLCSKGFDVDELSLDDLMSDDLESETG